MKRDPIGFLSELTAAEGDLAWFRVGRRPVLLVTDPETTREILVVRHDRFAKQNDIPRGAAAPEEDPGLLLSDDPARHLRGKRLLQPAFAKERAAAFEAVAREEAERVISGWADGRAVDVTRAMFAITAEMVGRVLYGAGFGSGAERLIDDSEVLAKAFRLVAPARRGAMRLLRLPSQLRRLGPLTRVLQLQATLLGSDSDAASIPRALEGAGDDELGARARLGESWAIFSAATETTSVALAWACYLLARHPDDLRRVRDDPSWASPVFTETLRLYPPAWYIGRRALADAELARVRIPAGSMVLLSPYLVQRDARWHPEPSQFLPARWAEGDEAKRSAFTFFPFGGGSRHCLGERLAWIEAKAVLRAIASRWQLSVPAGEPAPIPHPGASLGFAQPLRLLVSAW